MVVIKSTGKGRNGTQVLDPVKIGKNWFVPYAQPFSVTISYTVTADTQLQQSVFPTLAWVETCSQGYLPGMKPNVPFDVAQSNDPRAKAFLKPWNDRSHTVGDHQVTLDDQPGPLVPGEQNGEVFDVTGHYTNTIDITLTNPTGCATPKFENTVGIDISLVNSQFNPLPEPPAVKQVAP